MKMKLLLVPILVVIMLTMARMETASADQPDATGSSGIDLNGMMFTLSRDSGGVTFSRPGSGFHAPDLTTRYKAKDPTIVNTITTPPPAPDTNTTTTATTTRAPNTTTTATTTPAPNTTTTATTVSPARGVSVCLRFVTDAVQQSFPLFTVSPDGSPLSLLGSLDTFILSYNLYYNMGLEPIVPLWPNIKRDIWTSLCLTVDTSKDVVQLFTGGYMSPRKVLLQEYVWTGEPVINFPGFDGQLTDVHVWDYPLSYRNIFHYMSSSYYSGSVLSWSHISYALTGKAVMEESYDLQAKQAVREAEQERAPKEERLRFLSVGERKRGLFK